MFDEAQRWPELFSYLQGMVDSDRVPGHFFLTGSQQFGLLAGIGQTLAGRVGSCKLEASYIVHLLPPYHHNFGKRLVKSPKLYFLDTGLAAQYPCVVYGGEESYLRSGLEMVGWRGLGAKLRSSVTPVG